MPESTRLSSPTAIVMGALIPDRGLTLGEATGLPSTLWPIHWPEELLLAWGRRWLCQPELAPLFSFDLAPPRGSAEREFSFDLAPLPAGPVRLALICWRLVRCRPG